MVIRDKSKKWFLEKQVMGQKKFEYSIGELERGQKGSEGVRRGRGSWVFHKTGVSMSRGSAVLHSSLPAVPETQKTWS